MSNDSKKTATNNYPLITPTITVVIFVCLNGVILIGRKKTSKLGSRMIDDHTKMNYYTYHDDVSFNR